MNNDLISRAYLLDIAEKQNNLLDGGDVRNAPSVEAVLVVHGHWIDRGACLAEGTVYISYECSVCHEFHFIRRTSPQRTPPHCACCGSKMDEEVESEKI